MNCCDSHGLNRIFRGRFVDSDRRAFERNGADRRQRRFLAGTELDGKHLLDLGCGVGSLGLTGLQQGLVGARFVEVSQHYLRTAQELAVALGVVDHADFVQGDAALLDLDESDIVVLDRVVCCYPAGVELVSKAASLSRELLAFSYPRPSVWMRLGRWFLNSFMRLIGNPYRFHLHRPEELLAAATSAGHRLQDRSDVGVWQVLRFRRPSSPEE